MGGTKSKPAPPPTLKEMTKDMKRGIDRMIREFKREEMRINSESKKIKKDLERMIKKGEPKSSQRIMAQNFLKKQKMLEKYKGLEAKLEGVKMQIANISTTDTLVNTMKNMAGILNKSANAIDVNSIQHIIADFNMSLEKNTVMGELVEDAMDMGEDEVDDADADNLIDDISGGMGGGKELVNPDAEGNFEQGLKDLKI